MAPIGRDLSVDLVEQFQGEQFNVVLQCLVGIVRRVEGTVAEHFAQGVVMIDKFVQSVIVDVQVQADDATDKDRLQAHARPAITLIHRWRNLCFE